MSKVARSLQPWLRILQLALSCQQPSKPLRLATLQDACESVFLAADHPWTYVCVTDQKSDSGTEASFWHLQGTYYGAGADSGSYCRGNGFPYASGGLPTVAVSQTILQNGANCGSCIVLVGNGPGSGTTPISSDPTM